MSEDELQKQADLQRAEAKQLINSLFGTPPNASSDAVDRVVDCIIGATLLEVCLMMTKGAK